MQQKAKTGNEDSECLVSGPNVTPGHWNQPSWYRDEWSRWDLAPVSVPGGLRTLTQPRKYQAQQESGPTQKEIHPAKIPVQQIRNQRKLQTD